MRIAFITPTLHSLGPNWHRDPQIAKLAAPTLSGTLRAHGYEQIRQYDFEVELFALERRSPGTLDLTVFFDEGPVDDFLRGEASPRVAAQVELILEELEVEEADLYAFSCASVLEVYADMHAAGNINLCLATELRRRHPGCASVVGGLQMSPDSLHEQEYRSMHERCAALDFSVQGAGEPALLSVLDHLEGRAPLRPNPPSVVAMGDGLYIRNAHRGRIPVVSIQPKSKPRFEVPDEAPAGEHERRPLSNTSIEHTPWFDPRNIERRKVSGRELLARYHLEERLGGELEPYLDDGVAILPFIFMEGCNARCAFCAYSMTTLVKRDLDRVIEGIRWMVDTYGVRYFHFLNTNINGHMKYAEAFCDAVIESGLDILWSDCANLWALNEPLIDKMVASGCVRLTFGLECPSPRMLKYIHKGVRVEQAHARLKYAHDKGIWNHLLLITGLPTETPEDTRHFVEFLERSKDYTHGYSVSSFYLISSSLMGAFPEQYGLTMRSNASGLLEHQGFDEDEGLSWEEKQVQIVESTRLIQKTIGRLKEDPKYSSGAIDLELLFWLYDRLGHERKPDIVRAYEAAWLGAPMHVRYYRGPLTRVLADPPEQAAAPLSALGLTPRPESAREEGGVLSLPLGPEGDGLALRFRLDRTPDGPALDAGVSVEALDAALARLCAEGGKIRAPVEAKGLTLEVRPEPGRLTLRRGEWEVDLEVGLDVDGAPSMLKHGPLFFSYQVPKGRPEPPAVLLGFLEVLGGALLTELTVALRGTAVERIDRRAAGRLTTALVEVLEAQYRDELRPAHAIEGERHGNKFSRVTT